MIERISFYPMTESMLNRFSPVAASYSVECVKTPRYYLDSSIMPNSVELIKHLINTGYDVWFVSMPITASCYRCCEFEKMA